MALVLSMRRNSIINYSIDLDKFDELIDSEDGLFRDPATGKEYVSLPVLKLCLATLKGSIRIKPINMSESAVISEFPHQVNIKRLGFVSSSSGK